MRAIWESFELLTETFKDQQYMFVVGPHFQNMLAMNIINNIQVFSSTILILMLAVISGVNIFANRMWLALSRTKEHHHVGPIFEIPTLGRRTSVDNRIWPFRQRETYSAGTLRWKDSANLPVGRSIQLRSMSFFVRRFEGLHSTLTPASLCLDQGTGTNRSEESDQAKDSQIDLDGYRCRY